MKKLLAILMVLSMVTGLVALGSGTALADDEEKVIVQIGYENFPGEPLDLACNEWKRLVEEKSNGTMEVQLYPSSALGSKTDLLDQMQMGEGVITLSEGSFWADYGAPELSIMSAPYLYENWDQCWKLVDSDWYAEQCEILREQGFHVLTSNWAYGVRELMTVKPVRTVDDISGMIIRTPENVMQMRTLEAMGAAPTAMALGDVYTATQQGTIDGMENPIATLYGQSYYEVAKYVTMIDYIMMPIQWTTSETWFQSLTEEQQKILTESGDEAGLFNNQKQDEMIADYISSMEENGVEFIYPSEEENAAFKEAVLQIYDDPDVTGNWRDGLYDYIVEIISE